MTAKYVIDNILLSEEQRKKDPVAYALHWLESISLYGIYGGEMQSLREFLPEAKKAYADLKYRIEGLEK